MKKITACLIFIVFAGYEGKAQMEKDWGAFNQFINATPYQGKKFRLEAAVRSMLIDSTADAEVWARVDEPNNKMGFFYNMMDKPIRSKEWKVYSITGKIDKDASRFVFGGLYHRKGIFYFDAFKLFIETKKDQWQQIDLPDGSFESDSSIIKKSWGYLQARTGYKISVDSSGAFEGGKCFKIDGSNFKPEKTYGNNDSTGTYANVNGIRIYYEIYGQGEPLLLLHGNSTSISLFQKQIPEFQKYFKVIAVDTRGQGKSSEDGKLYTYDLFADDMNALLDHLHLDSVNVVGWSDGGNTGLIMAMKYPKKVKKLVTMGANVFIDNTVVAKWIFKELTKQEKELKNDTTAWAVNRLRLITLLKTEPRHSFAELNSIKCPVLVVAGEKDLIKEEHTKAIAANIPNSTLMIEPKATHYFPSDNPDAFNKAVIEFINK